MIFSRGMFALKVGWFLHFKFSTTLPVVGHCSCSEMNENGPGLFRPERTKREEDILIEKAIPGLTKYKTKLATEVFKDWQSSRALRDITSNELVCEMQELSTHIGWFGCMALTNSDLRNKRLSCLFLCSALFSLRKFDSL